MTLNYKEFGSGSPLIILHGLFGSLDNWVTLGKKFGEQHHVYIVDQRNHGQSPHNDTMSYEAMANDLIEFIDVRNIEAPTVLGHSMGGKTAMLAALKSPEVVEKLIIADMAPKSYPVHHRQILDGLLSVDLERISSRGEADDQLKPYIPEMGVRQFLLKNLYWKEKGKLDWRFNLKVLNRDIEKLGEWPQLNDKFNKPTLFIRGGKSNYLSDNDSSTSIFFPNSSIQTIPEAGHWVHAEAPDKFFELVTSF